MNKFLFCLFSLENHNNKKIKSINDKEIKNEKNPLRKMAK